jgi:DNA-binding beta-propeller fold protein YncE
MEGKRLREVKARAASPVWSLAFAPDGQTLAAGEASELVRYSMAGIVEPTKILPPGTETAAMARILPNRGAILDTGKGFGVAVNPTTGMLYRFTVPGYKADGLYRPDRTIYRILHDKAGEKVYAFRAEKSPPPAPHPRGQGVAVLVFGLDKFTAGAKPVGLKPSFMPDKQARVTGTVFCPRLSPDGKHLYWLDAETKQVVKFGTDLEGKPETLDLKGAPLALALSPDGKTLYALTDAVAGRSVLVIIEAGGMKAALTKVLTEQVHDVAAGPDGDVVLAGAGSLVWVSATTPTKAKRRVATGGKRYRVEASADGRVAVLCPEGTGETVLIFWPLTDGLGGRVTIPAGTTRATQGGDFSLSADGSRVALRSGEVVTVPSRWLPK